MILDRTLTPDLLDVALRISSSGEPVGQQHRLLTIALRDYVTDQEAAGKTKDCLSKVWISPLPEAETMVAWGRDHRQSFGDRRVLHLGALLATFPFAGSIAGIVGRSLALEGNAELVDVRRKARSLWGDRSTIDHAVPSACATLIRLGALSGGGRAPLARGEVFETDCTVRSWLVHSLLITRGVSSLDDADVGSAPELFWTKGGPRCTMYPLLERHNEGGRRVVWAAR